MRLSDCKVGMRVSFNGYLLRRSGILHGTILATVQPHEFPIEVKVDGDDCDSRFFRASELTVEVKE